VRWHSGGRYSRPVCVRKSHGQANCWQEGQRKMKEEGGHHAKEIFEAERERKREMARRAKEDAEDGKAKGKYPHWTQ
jgi:hypothetical protein